MGVWATVSDDDPNRRVETNEACHLLGVHRTTIWRWIVAGLEYERELEYPHRYSYRLADLHAMKLARTAARIAVPKRDPSEYDYQ